MAILPLLLLLSGYLLAGTAAVAAPVPQQFDIAHTVVKIPLEEGVTPDDAIEALQSKAISLNMKLVAHQPLSKELQARGVDSGRLDILQFCNPNDAHEMVQFNPLFAAYMPCRIALVEDGDGRYWLMMIDLDLIIDNTALPPPQKAIAERINRTLQAIMQAGASGDF